MTPDETILEIEQSETWDERVAKLRLVPQRHGTGDHSGIYAEVARHLYVPHLAPDYAYIHRSEFYEAEQFDNAYQLALDGTSGFKVIDVDTVAELIQRQPSTLLAFRTITGLTKTEFAASTSLVAEPDGASPLSAQKVDSMERNGSATSSAQARIAARTLLEIMAGSLFGQPSGALKTKQEKPDTISGWTTVQQFAGGGVPYSTFLHQRHYGGSFRQVLDATSTLRGNLIEDAVESLFSANGVPFVRTGSHNQAEVERRFEVAVRPAPDFVVFDASGTLRGMLECKGANDGGTARDKALRFARLREESVRLGGVPLMAVLGGLGWTRVNDTLGPVVRDCDGRVFTLATLDEILRVSPFPQLRGQASGAG